MSRRRWILAGAAVVMAVCLAAFAWKWQEEVEAYQAEEGITEAGIATRADTMAQAGGAVMPDGFSEITAANTGLLSAGRDRKAENPAEKAVKAALEKLKQAESMKSGFRMDMGIEVFRLKMDASAAMDMTTFRSPMKVKSDIDLELGFLGDTQLQVYALEQDENYLLYLKDENGWTRQETDAADLICYDGQKMMAVYLEQLVELEEAGTEKLPGGIAYKYTGVVKNDGLQRVLLDTGSLKPLPVLLQQHKLLKPLGALLQQQEEQLPDMLKKSEDVQVTLWIDADTGYPVQCSMDITRMLSEALELIINNAASSKNSTGTEIWSQLKITKTEIMIQCGEFNRAEDFEIPQEALKASKSSR